MIKLYQKNNLIEFFSKKVRDSLKMQNSKVSEEADFYLVQLLVHYAQSENLFEKNENGKVEYRALALKFHDAVFAEKDEQKYLHFKSLGDTALYHAGVFYEGLYQKLVDVNYYIEMGGMAFSSLANLSTSTSVSTGRSMSDLFSELSANFPELVEVLYMSLSLIHI